MSLPRLAHIRIQRRKFFAEVVKDVGGYRYTVQRTGSRALLHKGRERSLEVAKDAAAAYLEWLLCLEKSAGPFKFFK